MSLANLFDYDSLDVETRVVVQQKTGEIRERIKRTREDIIEIGERLIEIKSRLGHGRFGDWLRAEFDWSDRIARDFMSVAEVFKSALSSDLDITPTALRTLAAPSVPEEARREAISQAGAGNHIGSKEARSIVENHRSTPKNEEPNARQPLGSQTSFLDDELPAEPDEDSADPVIDFSPEWSDSELQRKLDVEHGDTVLANQRTDHELIRWAKQRGCYVAIDRGNYPLGNPMRIGSPDPSREDVIDWYRDHWLPSSRAIRSACRAVGSPLSAFHLLIRPCASPAMDSSSSWSHPFASSSMTILSTMFMRLKLQNRKAFR